MNDVPVADQHLDQELKRLQIANLQADLALKHPSWWIRFSTNPVTVAAAIAAIVSLIVSLAASYVSLLSSREQRQLDAKKYAEQLQYEFVKSEFDFILQAMRGANPTEASENLTFLLETGVIQRPALRSSLSEYLKNRKPHSGLASPDSPK